VSPEASCNECNISTNEWIMIHSYCEVKLVCIECFYKKMKSYDSINSR
jgi:hypothetical protein